MYIHNNMVCNNILCELGIKTKHQGKKWLNKFKLKKNMNEIAQSIYKQVESALLANNFCHSVHILNSDDKNKNKQHILKGGKKTKSKAKAKKAGSSTKKTFDKKIMTTLRQIENWSKIQANQRFDKASFDPKHFMPHLDKYAPKAAQLLSLIRELDEKDKKEHGKLYKHFIFSDIKALGYGAKILSSALIGAGYNCLVVNSSGSIKLKETEKQNRYKSFAVLSSTALYNKPSTEKLKQQILSRFNARPNNINGKDIRIIILDSGFKEGIDLFDVKYAHIYETPLTDADESQAIGRVTRLCGQKGLKFIKGKGWNVDVYMYNTYFDNEFRETYSSVIGKNMTGLHDMIVENSNLDYSTIELGKQISRLAPFLSVDYELTKNIHKPEEREFIELYGDGEMTPNTNKKQSYQSISNQNVGNSGKSTKSIISKSTKSKSKGKYDLSKYRTMGGGNLSSQTDFECDADCGLRANTTMPVTLKILETTYREYMMKKEGKKVKLPMKERRQYLCNKMSSNPEYCAMVKKEWAKNRIKEMKKSKSKSLLSKTKSKTKSKSLKAFRTQLKKSASRSKTEKTLGSEINKLEKELKDANILEKAVKSASATNSRSYIKSTKLPLKEIDEKLGREEKYVDYDDLDYKGKKTEKYKNKAPKSLLSFKEMRNYIATNFMNHKWDKLEVINKCEEPKIEDKLTPETQHIEEMLKQLKSKSRTMKMSKSKTPPMRAKDRLITYTPTQDFVRNYFTPYSPYKGLFLWHSVGTGKTCSAIATASTTFEREGYSILWVTRNTLRGDVWKNIFGKICHDIIAEEVRNGTIDNIEPIISKRKRELMKTWITPITYKQFSNLLSGKNEFYKLLEKRNGKQDILKKTLVIIDEAHKLYSEDLKPQEKPNVEVMNRIIHNSYSKSGKNSVRLLLMTATPYTDTPMTFFKLLNMMKEDKSKYIETDMVKFRDEYMDKKTNLLSKHGFKKLLNKVTGYISYLNRSKDASQFAQINKIHVPVIMSHYNNEERIILANPKEIIQQWKENLNVVKQVYNDYIEKEMKSKIKKLNEKKSKLKEQINEKKAKAKKKYVGEKNKNILKNKMNHLDSYYELLVYDINEQIEELKKIENDVYSNKLRRLIEDMTVKIKEISTMKKLKEQYEEHPNQEHMLLKKNMIMFDVEKTKLKLREIKKDDKSETLKVFNTEEDTSESINAMVRFSE